MGDDITSLLSGAKKRVLIVAPFMRSEALSRLLDSIPVGTETTVVTRWRPTDLLAGASDLGVYDLTESRSIPSTTKRQWGCCRRVGFHVSGIPRNCTRSIVAIATSAALLSGRCKKSSHRSAPFPEWTRKGSEQWVAAAISQTPLVGRVIQRIDKEGQVTEDALSDLLAEIGVDAEECRPRDVLEILERWLTYFLPTKYETARDSIKLIKAKQV